jgi:hypothetical protein
MHLFRFALLIGMTVLVGACAPMAFQPTPEPSADTASPPSATSLPLAIATVKAPPASPTVAADNFVVPSATLAPSLATLPPTVPSTTTVDLSGGQPQGGLVPPAIIARAVDDLVQRTGADPADVQTLLADAVLWPDGSLGCPEPNAAYTQAEVAGYHLLLSVQGETYDYRGGEQFVRLCGTPVRQRP